MGNCSTRIKNKDEEFESNVLRNKQKNTKEFITIFQKAEELLQSKQLLEVDLKQNVIAKKNLQGISKRKLVEIGQVIKQLEFFRQKHRHKSNLLQIEIQYAENIPINAPFSCIDRDFTKNLIELKLKSNNKQSPNCGGDQQSLSGKTTPGSGSSNGHGDFMYFQSNIFERNCLKTQPEEGSFPQWWDMLTMIQFNMQPDENKELNANYQLGNKIKIVENLELTESYFIELQAICKNGSQQTNWGSGYFSIDEETLQGNIIEKKILIFPLQEYEKQYKTEETTVVSIRLQYLKNICEQIDKYLEQTQSFEKKLKDISDIKE